MTDTTDLNNISELAGEYVLGTLSASQRRPVEERLPLVALAEPVDPSAQLWQRLKASMGQATTAPAAARRVEKHGWWNSVQLWRGLVSTGFAAAAVLAAVLVTRPGAVPSAPQYMVVLVVPQGKAPGWVIQTSSVKQLSLIPLGQAVVPAEKSLQFWTKGENWSRPVSLGLVKPGQTIQIPLDKLPPLQPNQLFELTLEPVNGSPLNRPTGAIQFIGRAVKVI